jgi:hypothetical protein
MSAFTVDIAHIDTIVNAMRQFAGVPVPASAPREIGQLLWNENYASVNYRYSESESTPDYRPTITDEPLSAVAVLKALDCYTHQTCEHPDWQTSEAKRLIDALHALILSERPEWAKQVRSYGGWTSAYTKLPEYDAAPWEVTSLDQVAAVIVKAEQEQARKAEEHRGEGAVYREVGRLDIVEIAKRMRVNLKNAQSAGMLPEGARFSVTTDRFSMGQSVDVEIQGMPDSWTYTTREAYWNPAETERIYSDEAAATVKAIESMLSEYNRDRSDIQSDYFDVWFYSHVRIEDERSAQFRAEEKARKAKRATARKAQRAGR